MQSLESTPSKLADMPPLNRGMDLNPIFTSSTAFHPTMTGGEFASAGISLVHGWLINPVSPEHTAVLHVRDYDAAMNLIVEADVLTCRLLMGTDADQSGDNMVPSQAGPSHTNINLTEEERWKVEEGKYHVELPSTT
jgi:ubiquitin carboxyl-terminal hydrolase MINDY-1/2